MVWSISSSLRRASCGFSASSLAVLAWLRAAAVSSRRRMRLASASFVAFSVYFYEQEGLTGVGVLGLVRMAAAVAAIPLASAIVDRYPRQRLLLGVAGSIPSLETSRNRPE